MNIGQIFAYVFQYVLIVLLYRGIINICNFCYLYTRASYRLKAK